MMGVLRLASRLFGGKTESAQPSIRFPRSWDDLTQEQKQQRLQACVDATEGTETEFLQGFACSVSALNLNLKEVISSISGQRDELLAAVNYLKSIERPDCYRLASDLCDDDRLFTLEEIRGREQDFVALYQGPALMDEKAELYRLALINLVRSARKNTSARDRAAFEQALESACLVLAGAEKWPDAKVQ